VKVSAYHGRLYVLESASMLQANGGEPAGGPTTGGTGVQKGELDRSCWRITITFPTVDSKFLRMFSAIRKQSSVIEELLKWRAETPYPADDDYICASPKMLIFGALITSELARYPIGIPEAFPRCLCKILPRNSCAWSAKNYWHRIATLGSTASRRKSCNDCKWVRHYRDRSSRGFTLP